MLTEQLKEQRRLGIGGSDAAAVVGLSRYKTPVDVYLQKLGLAPDDEENEAAYWGNVLEEIVANEFVRRTNELIKHSGDLIQNKKYPWMIANVDRLLAHKNAVLECKTASAYKSGEWGEENTDEMPDEYLLQCAHYRIVTDCDYVALAVLIGGQQYRQYKYEKNSTLEERLIQREHDFWHKHVLPQEPPEVRSYEDALRLFNACNDTAKQVNEQVADRLTDYVITKLEIKNLMKKTEALKMEICKYLGTDSILLDELGQSVATWKNKTMRRLNIDKLKQEQPDIYKQYLTETITREFRLRRGLEIYE